MRFVFSDITRATRSARDIHRYLAAQGYSASLTRGQGAMAQGLGYRDWAELRAVTVGTTVASPLDAAAGPVIARARAEQLAQSLVSCLVVSPAHAAQAVAYAAPTGVRGGRGRPAPGMDSVAEPAPGPLVQPAEAEALPDMAGPSSIRVLRTSNGGVCLQVESASSGRYTLAGRDIERLLGIMALCLDTPVPTASISCQERIDDLQGLCMTRGLAWPDVVASALGTMRLGTRYSQSVVLAPLAVDVPPEEDKDNRDGIGQPRQPAPSTVQVCIMEWEEHERGWGIRPDGYSVHSSQQAWDSFLQDYWSRMPKNPPHEYSCPSWNGLKTYQLPADHPLAVTLVEGRCMVSRGSAAGRSIQELLTMQPQPNPGMRA